MKKLLWGLCGVYGSFLMMAGCQSEDATPPSTMDRPQEIVNGTLTDYERWQSAIRIVGFTRRGLTVSCTGTLIHPRLILTAGHCIYLKDGTSDYNFATHPHDLNLYGGKDGEMLVGYGKEVVVHPSWSGNIDYNTGDLAFILIASEVTDIEPASVGDFPGPAVGDSGIIVGYGSDPTDPGDGTPHHREGVTDILSETPFYFEIGGETNTCNGDSGGPLFTEQDGEWVLSAVTSFGSGDCDVEDEGFSVNLLPFCAWLNDTMQTLVGTDLDLDKCTRCNHLAPQDGWGGPCGPGYPCCPDGTVCRTPDEFSTGGLGFCAPACCDIGFPDEDICADVAAGDEGCLFVADDHTAFCAIACQSDDDCPEGTECKNKPFESDGICIARQPGDSADCDETDRDTDTDGNIGATTENGTDSEETRTSESAKNGGCNQAIPGVGLDRSLLIQLCLLFFG